MEAEKICKNILITFFLTEYVHSATNKKNFVTYVYWRSYTKNDKHCQYENKVLLTSNALDDLSLFEFIVFRKKLNINEIFTYLGENNKILNSSLMHGYRISYS